MAAEQKGGVICLKCGKILEVSPRRSLEKEVLEKGWGKISVKRKNIEEIFFFCESCLAKFLGEIE